LSGRIRAASASAGSLRQSALFLDEFERFQELHSASPAAPAVADPVAAGVLNIDEVSFSYPGTEPLVLDNVSLQIAPGEIVALVGESGSGKTTLAHLVAGLYWPTDGSISYGTQDIRDIGRARWWRSVATVFQDFSRYELSARENIAMSDRTRADDLEAVRSAAQRANIADELGALAAGYDTMLSRSYEGGVDLSVGQWQRVAVARAFFRDAPLLILDEPAAALDARAEQVLHERVEELCQDRSALIISHRFSTVRLADRICVMSQGRIVESGTHPELMDLGGQYAELFNLQARGYQMGSGPAR